MKKIFIFAATAALLASCAKDEVLNNYEPTAEKAIGFSTIANKVTRAENSGEENKLDLFRHHESFSVYGYKNVNATTKGIEVFDNQLVTVNSNNTTSYDPVRYWDKAASDYFFYAAAPSDGAWTFTKPTDLTTPILTAGYYKTTSTLTGANITTFDDENAYKYQESFKESGDIDKLIADPCPVQNAAYNKSTADVVELNFNHILSRLNVEVKSAITPKYNQLKVTVGEDPNLPLFSYDTDKLCVKDGETYYQVTKGDDGTYSYGDSKIEVPSTTSFTQVDDKTSVKSGKVELVAITVNDFNGVGSFDESLANESSTPKLSDGTIARWTTLSGDEDVKYEPTTALNLSVEQNGIKVDEYKYVCQSLVIPQKAEYEAIALDGSGTRTKPYINVKFEIDGQPYSYFYNLAAVFSPELQSVFEDDGGKWTKDIDGEKVYVKDGKYSSAKDAAEYTTVVLKNGNAYTLANGTLVYYYNSKYYTTMTSETVYDDEITPDCIIPVYETETSGTYAPQFLTNAEAIAKALRTAEAFALAFNEGWQNNLQVKIGPSAIQFIGHVYKWDDYKTGELTVE